MQIQSHTLTMSDYERIAQECGVRLYNSQEQGHTRAGARKVTLLLRTRYATPNAPYRKCGHQRRKDGERRTAPGLVCYHGHYAFMEAVMDADENAKIICGWYVKVTYDGRDSFYAQAGDVGTVNIGSMMDPQVLSAACYCVEPLPRRERKNIQRRLARGLAA